MGETPVINSEPSIASPHLREPGLQKIGLNPVDAVIARERIGIRETHEQEIIQKRKTAETTDSLTGFLKSLKSHTMPLQTGSPEDVSPSERERLLKLAKKTGADPELTAQLLFGNPATQEEGLIVQARKIWKSIAPTERKTYYIGQKIADMCNILFKDNQDMRILLSTEQTIPLQTPQGEIVVSPRDLFAQNLDAFSSRIADLQRTVIDAYLTADKDLAIYEAFDWTKRVSKEVADGKLRIFPTPDTEMVNRQIAIAHAKRNGVLKYVLYGEAGVGKTRMIQEDDIKRDKQTVVINFHHFISFEDLIGQTAVAVDIPGATSAENLDRAVARFVDSGQSPEQFWEDMTKVHEQSPTLKKRYASVEDMVQDYGRELGTEETDTSLQTREDIRAAFQARIKAIRDTSILSLDEKNKDLQTRWAQGAIVKAMREGKVVCFDEMDKAGKYAIEGLLSFLSLEPGSTWTYQGGTEKIPEDFYVTATSNRANIGALTDDQGMNRFLADRCEQILVKPQSVKGALMIAGVHVSNEKGDLLIGPEEQVHLVNAFSYILPRLQEANLDMPVTNRIIKTICSRLVDFEDTSDGKKRYFRVLGGNGSPQTVASALRLSLLEMKGMSLGEKGEKIVREAIDSFRGLMGEGKVKKFGQGLRWYQPSTNREEQLQQRLGVLESIANQPLFQAVAHLEGNTISLGDMQLEEVDNSLLGLANVAELVQKQGGLEMRTMGRANGILLEPSEEGIHMKSEAEGIEVGQKLALQGNYEGAQIVSADQLGEVFVVRKTDGSVDIISKGQVIRQIQTPVKDKSIVVDPKGRYVLVVTENNVECASTIKDAQGEVATEIVGFNNNKTILVDISPDGDKALCRDANGFFVANFGKSTPSFLYLVTGDYFDMENWDNARFIGHNLVAGLDQQGNISRNNSQQTKLITVSS